VTDFAWSPDGKRLALVAKDADPDDEPKKKDGWKRKTAPPIVIDRYHFKQDREGYLKRFYDHIAVFDIASKKVDQITTGGTGDANPVWSPDGKLIAFRSKRAQADPDRTGNDDLFVVEARAGAQPRQLTTTPEGESGRPTWSPDGSRIAALQGDLDKYGAYDLNRLVVVPSNPPAGPTAPPACFHGAL